MGYLWAASVAAILARKWIWEIVMYVLLFYACHKLAFPAFAKIKRWIGIALVICAVTMYVPKIHWVMLGSVVVQSLLYFGVWYQCVCGIQELEKIYGNLRGRGMLSAYWLEAAWAAVGIYALAVPLAPWFKRVIPLAIFLVQAWKAYLLYRCQRDYETRRRQLAGLPDDR